MDTRPSRDTALMRTALVWAERSTCSRLPVGVVIANNGRILVQGYNGAPAGMTHCDHTCACGFTDPVYQPSEVHRSDCAMVNPCDIAVHAEANAIAWAARHGITLNESQMYTTHMPCFNCAKLIINAGVGIVTYFKPYRDQSGVKLLTRAGVDVIGYES